MAVHRPCASNTYFAMPTAIVIVCSVDALAIWGRPPSPWEDIKALVTQEVPEKE